MYAAEKVRHRKHQLFDRKFEIHRYRQKIIWPSEEYFEHLAVMTTLSVIGTSWPSMYTKSVLMGAKLK